APSAAPAAPAGPTGPVARSDGRTPGRGSAIRAGIVLGSALVLVLGTAVVMGASPSSPGPSTQNGAQPSAPPSAAPNHDGNAKRGPSAGGPFGRVFGPPPVPV